MTSERVNFVLRFLVENLSFSPDELRALHDVLGRDLRQRAAPLRPMKRTLYLPNDRLDDL